MEISVNVVVNDIYCFAILCKLALQSLVAFDRSFDHRINDRQIVFFDDFDLRSRLAILLEIPNVVEEYTQSIPIDGCF